MIIDKAAIEADGINLLDMQELSDRVAGGDGIIGQAGITHMDEENGYHTVYSQAGNTIFDKHLENFPEPTITAAPAPSFDISTPDFNA